MCYEKQFNAVVYTPRGCDDLKTPRIFTLSDNKDIRHALDHIRASTDESPIVGVAFSLGGNMLVNYIGDCGKRQIDTHLVGAVTMAQGS